MIGLPLLASPWLWLGLAVAAAGAFGKLWDHERQAFASYRGAVEALNRAAEERTRARIALDRQRKEHADAENAAALAGFRATVDRLRRSAGPVGPIVPAAAPGARDPGRACFDRAVLEREIRGALEDFRAAARGVVEEGDTARLKLDTAIRWVQRQNNP